MTADGRDDSSSARSYFWLVIAFVTSWTGIAGIVEGLVEWRSFFENLFQHYRDFRTWLLHLFPTKTPNAVADYIVAGAGISVITRTVVVSVFYSGEHREYIIETRKKQKDLTIQAYGYPAYLALLVFDPFIYIYR